VIPKNENIEKINKLIEDQEYQNQQLERELNNLKNGQITFQ